MELLNGETTLLMKLMVDVKRTGLAGPVEPVRALT
jgi:hypothetical protein